jgi:hypothetical protein
MQFVSEAWSCFMPQIQQHVTLQYISLYNKLFVTLLENMATQCADKALQALVAGNLILLVGGA